MEKVCVKCQVELRPHTNGVVAISMASFGEYQLYDADTWQCPECGWCGVLDFARRPFAEHYEPKFAESLATVQRDRVCVRFWRDTVAKNAAFSVALAKTQGVEALPENESETKHTATPWECVGCEGARYGLVASVGGAPDYKTTEVAKFHRVEDMKFAIHVCNSHDDLCEQVKKLRKVMKGIAESLYAVKNACATCNDPAFAVAIQRAVKADPIYQEIVAATTEAEAALAETKEPI